MGWAANHIARLRQGETISFRPRGHSMTGKVNDGELVTVVPVTDDCDLQAGDIVLCKVNGMEYLHLIKAVQDDRFQIGNNQGRINGWTNRHNIFGLCVRVEK